MKLEELIPLVACSTQIVATTKEEALRAMASLLRMTPQCQQLSVDEIYASFMKREQLGSTGVGDGVAIPHCRLEKLTSFVLALGVCRAGVSYEALDGKEVKFFCAIAGPEKDSQTHLRLLAMAGRILSSGKVRYNLFHSASEYALRERFLAQAASAQEMERPHKQQLQKLMFIVLQEEKVYREVMELFLEMGVVGAVTMAGDLMGQALSNIPLFASYLDVLGRSKVQPKTIMVLVDEQHIHELVANIEQFTGDLDTHRGACIMVTGLELVRGSLETM